MGEKEEGKKIEKSAVRKASGTSTSHCEITNKPNFRITLSPLKRCLGKRRENRNASEFEQH